MYIAIPPLMASESASITPVWVAVIGGLITIGSWFFFRWKENSQRAIESELKYRERQIEEFYGPLFSLAHQVRRASEVQDGFTDFAKSKYYKGGNATDQEKKDKEKAVRHWFRTKYFDPLHRKMIQILKGKLYLIEAAKVPSSFVDYLKHACDDRARTELCNEEEGYPPCPFKWPEDFEKQLSCGLETAMQERDKLLSRRRKGFGFVRTAGSA